jgi:hypothetical protein
LSTETYRLGQRKQEEACAQAFLDWLCIKHNIAYKLKRAEECSELKGRWDFVAWGEEHSQWLAIEVKGLVIPQPRKQFSSWSKFGELVTEELLSQKRIKGSFAIITHVPWQFNQKQTKPLLKAFIDALTEVHSSIALDGLIDLGPGVASRFNEWPTKPPTINRQLLPEQFKVIYPPEELSITKINETGCSVEIGASVGQIYEVVPSLSQALLDIFNPNAGKGAKPNEQLREAKLKGALETILLLDSHIRSTPKIVANVLNTIEQSLTSNIDVVYLVSETNNRVERVWPSS